MLAQQTYRPGIPHMQKMKILTTRATLAVSLRRLILAAATLIATLSTLSAATLQQFSDEELHYKVLFKWGLVNKTAGTATLRMTSNPKTDTYRAVLTARSEPWADRIYSLRDTLTSVMQRSNLVPKFYERIAHENGRYERDRIEFTRLNNEFSATCTRTRRKKQDTETTTSTNQLSATGMTVDFISAFYYLRSLDFTSMLPEHTVTINIFSGKHKELLRFRYKGIESIDIDGKRRNAFKVEFTFTSDGKKETSDPITAWITSDGQRIPLQIRGKLPVGSIVCRLTE